MRWTWAGFLVAAVGFPAGVVARQPETGVVDVVLTTVAYVVLVTAAAGRGNREHAR